MMRAVPAVHSVFNTLAGTSRGSSFGIRGSHSGHRWGVALAVALSVHGLALLFTIGSGKIPVGQFPSRNPQLAAPAPAQMPARSMSVKKASVEVVRAITVSPHELTHQARIGASTEASVAAFEPARPFTSQQSTNFEQR